MKSKFDSALLGLTTGLVAPIILMFLYWKLIYGYMEMDKFINYMVLGKIYTKLISLFVVINLAFFFLFLWNNSNNSAKGVLGATFIYTFLIVILKVFD